MLTVGGIEVGTEAVVWKRLDAMMRKTNAAAARARKERDEIVYARQQASRRRRSLRSRCRALPVSGLGVRRSGAHEAFA